MRRAGRRIVPFRRRRGGCDGVAVAPARARGEQRAAVFWFLAFALVAGGYGVLAPDGGRLALGDARR